MPRRPVDIETLPPFVPRAERAGRPSKWREIMCRRCARWMTHRDCGHWHHDDDDTLACLDPASLAPYPDVCDPR